jgi:hypothetical protein
LVVEACKNRHELLVAEEWLEIGDGIASPIGEKMYV